MEDGVWRVVCGGWCVEDGVGRVVYVSQRGMCVPYALPVQAVSPSVAD